MTLDMSVSVCEIITGDEPGGADMDDARLRRYARQLLVCGVNLQQGQEIFITAATEARGFTELFTEVAFGLGAGNVEICFFEALQAKGMNTSTTHVDFMFGTADLRCVGTSADGNEVVIMDDGEIVVGA
jgi:leucyl aminopeptidase (aminopeptidase T)